MNPQNRTVWLTGASSGIGRALAVEMARAGAHVLLSARRLDRLEDAADECRRYGVRAAVLPFDLERPEEIASALRRVGTEFPEPDILVHAAGVGMRGRALETDESVARRVMEVDFWSAVELVRAVAPGMVSRGRGQIVVVTGVLAKFGAPRRSFYSASKHALHGWFDSLREELLGTGVDVTLLVPGWVRTGISEAALEADGRAHGVMDAGQEKGIPPEECARRAMPAIRRGAAEQLIGGIECGGVYLNRLWPGLFRRLLRRRGIG